MNIGVIGVQGNVSEHIETAMKAMEELGYEGEVIWIRRPEQIDEVKALIIPGGESTAISKLIDKAGMYPKIIAKANNGIPIMGTCAGCILLAKEDSKGVQNRRTKLLELMDMEVDRNAFGRQRESFEMNLSIEGLGTFPAVFIRAPAITRVWNDCKALAKIDDRIVMARQSNMLALAFHPELSHDTRIHKMFLEMIKP